MTDSKTATERLREMLDARGVEWESKDVEGVKGFHDTRWQAMGVQWCYVEFVGNNYNKLKPAREFHCTPEQAIAATLGSDRDEIYNAGFASGIQTVFQQLEGIEDFEELQELIDEYWADGEGNDDR